MTINLGRMKIWDWGVVGAFVLTIIGLSVPWWSRVGINFFGWKIDAGGAAFSFALFAALWVAVKMLLPADRPLPKWYMEAWPVMIFGGVCVICGIVGTADDMGGLSWRPGGLITLIAALGITACGFLMFKDKGGDYGESEVPKINVVGGGSGPGAPRSGGGSFCVSCGDTLPPDATFCTKCGKQA